MLFASKRNISLACESNTNPNYTVTLRIYHALKVSEVPALYVDVSYGLGRNRVDLYRNLLEFTSNSSFSQNVLPRFHDCWCLWQYLEADIRWKDEDRNFYALTLFYCCKRLFI